MNSNPGKAKLSFEEGFNFEPATKFPLIASNFKAKVSFDVSSPKIYTSLKYTTIFPQCFTHGITKFHSRLIFNMNLTI